MKEAQLRRQQRLCTGRQGGGGTEGKRRRSGGGPERQLQICGYGDKPQANIAKTGEGEGGKGERETRRAKGERESERPGVLNAAGEVRGVRWCLRESIELIVLVGVWIVEFLQDGIVAQGNLIVGAGETVARQAHHLRRV